MNNKTFRKALAFTVFLILNLTIYPSGVIGDSASSTIEGNTSVSSSSQRVSSEITVQIYGINQTSMQETSILSEDAAQISADFEQLIQNLELKPYNSQTQQLERQLLLRLKKIGVLPGDESIDELMTLLHPTVDQPTQPLGDRLYFNHAASERFCSFFSFGTGAPIPIIAFPRFLPILLTPLPRLLMRWKADNATTVCERVRSQTGFIAKGEQKGVALGFWGIGLTISTLDSSTYGLIGYTLFTTATADSIEPIPEGHEPEITRTKPADRQENVPVFLSELQFTIDDSDGDLMDYIVSTDPDIGSEHASQKPAGTYSIPVTGLQNDTKYSWNVQITDGTSVTEQNFTFETGPLTPYLLNESPPSEMTGVSLNPYLNITVLQVNGFQMNVTKRTNASGEWRSIFWLNNTGNTTMSNSTSGIFISYEKIYYWSVNATDTTGAWINQTYTFTTGAIQTSVDDIQPYTIPSDTLNVTVAGDDMLDSVTLYYRFSADNHSNWNPGVDDADITYADAVTKAEDSDMDYPQRIWYDETFQRAYICCYDSDTLQIYDVSRQWDIQKETQLKLPGAYFNGIHGILVFTNYSYHNRDYGIVAFVVNLKTPTYLSAVRCNLSTTPELIDEYALSGSGAYLTSFVNENGDLILIATEMNSGIARIFNCSNPENIKLVSTITELDEPWWPTVDPTHYYVYFSQFGTNKTTTIYDISDVTNPIYAGYQPPDEPRCQSFLMRYIDPTNQSILFTINASYLQPPPDPTPYNDRPLTAFDISNPLHWVELSRVYTNSTAEFNIDYSGDWALVRHWVYHGNNSGVDLFNIRDPLHMYRAEYFGRDDLTISAHMQWLDMNNSRAFILSYGGTAGLGGDSFVTLNITVNLSQESSWYAYQTDTEYPWEFSFDFPQGAGHYEFCSIGIKSGIDDEEFPVYADAKCYYNGTAEHPPRNSDPVILTYSVNLSTPPQLLITIRDDDGDLLNVTFFTNVTGEWGIIGTNISVGNGTYTQTNDSMTDENTTYWWAVLLTDEKGGRVYETYSFIIAKSSPI